MTMVDFDRERDWPFEQFTNRKSGANRERMKRNTNIFGDWLLGMLKSTAPRPKEEDEKYDTTHVYMHPSHNLYLQQHIGPWDYLDYSPVDDETVPLDKVMITNWFAKE